MLLAFCKKKLLILFLLRVITNVTFYMLTSSSLRYHLDYIFQCAFYVELLTVVSVFQFQTQFSVFFDISIWTLFCMPSSVRFYGFLQTNVSFLLRINYLFFSLLNIMKKAQNVDCSNIKRK